MAGGGVSARAVLSSAGPPRKMEVPLPPFLATKSTSPNARNGRLPDAGSGRSQCGWLFQPRKLDVLIEPAIGTPDINGTKTGGSWPLRSNVTQHASHKPNTSPEFRSSSWPMKFSTGRVQLGARFELAQSHKAKAKGALFSSEFLGLVFLKK